MTTTPPKHRRWFQFRLRTLLVVTALISVAMSVWLSHRQLKAEVADRYTTLQQPL